jgi:hypothetical protein
MDYSKFKQLIIENFEGKRIEEKDIRNLMHIDDYNLYYQIVMIFVEEELLRPIIASGSNGLNPALHKRYQVIKIDKSFDCYLGEIKKLHPIFNIEGYLGSPFKYSNDREFVLKLNEFFRYRTSLLEEPASINERSFQIFGIEKMIKNNPVFRSIIGFNANLDGFLNMYNAPEPFFEHVINDSMDLTQYNILIVENKDTWYSLRKIMSNGNNRIGDLSIDCLLYGEGKKITRKKDSLTEYTQANYGDKLVEYFYFGDLDMEGIGIFENLITANSDLNIYLMKELYVDMLNEAKGIILPKSSEQQQVSGGNVFFSYFDEDQMIEIKDLLYKGIYIPQEILTYGYFKRKIEMSGENDGFSR